MQLYSIRHGQTVWNAAGKLQGRTDIELNQNGIDAAVALGRRLQGVHFDKIFSSPLKRDASARAAKERDRFLAYNDTPYACVKLAQL